MLIVVLSSPGRGGDVSLVVLSSPGRGGDVSLDGRTIHWLSSSIELIQFLSGAFARGHLHCSEVGSAKCGIIFSDRSEVEGC